MGKWICKKCRGTIKISLTGVVNSDYNIDELLSQLVIVKNPKKVL